MRDADRVLLDGLALMTDLREDEWALVVREVEGAGGVREVGGQARIEIERAVQKARTLTSKARPSDPKAGENQAKRPAPVKPRKKQKIFTDGRRFSRSLMPLGSKPENYPLDEYELINPDGTPYKFQKAQEPVVKHPGHADQSVHGGGRGRGASGSTSASSAGAERVLPSNKKEQEASDAVTTEGLRANERMAGHQREMSETIYGKGNQTGFLGLDDEAELMGISDTLSFAGESVASLSPGRKTQYKEITDVRSSLKEADASARLLTNKKAQRAARRAIRLTDEELVGLMKTHREQWSGVGGMIED